MSDQQDSGGRGAPEGYGAPAAYGQAVPYGAPTYGQASPYGAYGQPPFGPPPLPEGVSYASWGSRLAALLIDSVMLFVCFAPALVVTAVAASRSEPGEGPSTPAGITIAVFFIGGILFWLYNFTWTQGKRGQSWGKRVVGIHLVGELELRPPGGGMGVARYLLRTALGNVTCGVYSVLTGLWPLWDEKNQSLDDKMLHTLVVRLPK
jgi:uncharacterized RDD family membrane protein YckC